MNGSLRCVGGGGGWGGGSDGDRLAGENGDADSLIKIDAPPLCRKCN